MDEKQENTNERFKEALRTLMIDFGLLAMLCSKEFLTTLSEDESWYREVAGFRDTITKTLELSHDYNSKV